MTKTRIREAKNVFDVALNLGYSVELAKTASEKVRNAPKNKLYLYDYGVGWIYLLSRQEKKCLLPNAWCKETGLPFKIIFREYRKIKKEHKLKINNYCYGSYVTLIIEGCELSKNVSVLSRKLLRDVFKDNIFCYHKPIIVICAAIYVASNGLNEQRYLSEICREADVTEYAVSKVVRKFNSKYGFEFEPFGSALEVVNESTKKKLELLLSDSI